MKSTKQFLMAVSVLTGLGLCTPAVSFAAEAVASLEDPLGKGALKLATPDGSTTGGPPPTTDFLAYAEQTDPKAPRLPNHVSRHSIDVERVPTIPVPNPEKPVPEEKGYLIISKLPDGSPGAAYGPTVAVRGRPKLNYANFHVEYPSELVSSESGQWGAYSSQQVDNSGIQKIVARVSNGQMKVKPMGMAAAETLDPIVVPAGEHSYEPKIGVVLEREDSREFAGVTFFAQDSDGPLWSLTITAAGLLSDSSSTTATLELFDGRLVNDDQALNAWEISDRLERALVKFGGNLSNYSPFPPGTKYVRETETEYENGVTGVVELHTDCNPDSIEQTASEFECIEMVSPYTLIDEGALIIFGGNLSDYSLLPPVTKYVRETETEYENGVTGVVELPRAVTQFPASKPRWSSSASRW